MNWSQENLVLLWLDLHAVTVVHSTFVAMIESFMDCVIRNLPFRYAEGLESHIMRCAHKIDYCVSFFLFLMSSFSQKKWRLSCSIFTFSVIIVFSNTKNPVSLISCKKLNECKIVFQ